jgi:hypothetical protein
VEWACGSGAEPLEGKRGSGFSWAAEKKMAERAKRVGGREKSFSFSFQIFQSHF